MRSIVYTTLFNHFFRPNVTIRLSHYQRRFYFWHYDCSWLVIIIWRKIHHMPARKKTIEILLFWQDVLHTLNCSERSISRLFDHWCGTWANDSSINRNGLNSLYSILVERSLAWKWLHQCRLNCSNFSQVVIIIYPFLRKPWNRNENNYWQVARLNIY